MVPPIDDWNEFSRLNCLTDIGRTDPSNPDEFRQPKRRKVYADHGSPTSCTAESSGLDKFYVGVNRRRSQRISASELGKREIVLLRKEEECRKRAEELDERSRCIKKLEAEASLRVLHAHRREARDTLTQLEDHFTCAL
jgi:hypothetical protein